MDYRVDDLADATGVSVSAIRAYQSKGLLPPPRHEGRIALYGDHHRERVREIQQLKANGHSLLVIGRLLQPGRTSDDGHDRLDREETLTRRELSERTGVPVAMLRSLEASGLLRALRNGGSSTYTESDARAVRLLLTMLSAGVPLEEVIRVAQIQLEAVEKVTSECARLFMTHVRDPLHASGLPRNEEAEHVVAALRTMLHGTTALLAYSFQRMMLNAATDELSHAGTAAERAALARHMARRLELPLPG